MNSYLYISNFKIKKLLNINDVEFVFKHSSGKTSLCNYIVAKNGIGKSNILRAIASTVIAVDTNQEGDFDYEKFISYIYNPNISIQRIDKFAEDPAKKWIDSIMAVPNSNYEVGYNLKVGLKDYTYKISISSNVNNINPKSTLDSMHESSPVWYIEQYNELWDPNISKDEISLIRDAMFVPTVGLGPNRLYHEFPTREYQSFMSSLFPECLPISNKILYNYSQNLKARSVDELNDLISFRYKLLDYLFKSINQKVVMGFADFGIENVVPNEKNDSLVYTINGNSVQMKNLSSGYQSLLCILYNIIYSFYPMLHSLDRFNYSLEECAEYLYASPIVVLIDEIDIHYHPSWQVKVVNFLRKTFKNAQFIFTTHSIPLISETDEAMVFILDQQSSAGSRNNENSSASILQVYDTEQEDYTLTEAATLLFGYNIFKGKFE